VIMIVSLALALALAWAVSLAGAISAAPARLSLAALRGSTFPSRAVPSATHGISIAAGASCRASVSAFDDYDYGCGYGYSYYTPDSCYPLAYPPAF